jgi:hypothetical protein
MPPKSSKGESKQGLVITLVFFILATLGLGVATYYGFADQEAKDKAVKEAKKNEDLFKQERDWYKFQAQLYRTYIGQNQGIAPAELALKKDEFDKGALKGPDKEEVTKVIARLDKDLGWNKAENKPQKTYDDMQIKARNDYEALEKRTRDLDAALVAANKQVNEAKDQLEKAKQDFEQSLQKLAKKAGDDQSNDRKTIDDLRNEITRLGGEKETLMKKGDADRQTQAKQLKQLNTQINQLKDLVKARTEALEAISARSNVAPPTLRTDWKIVKMDRRGTNPYINLGSADRVKPQLTFGIHGVTLDGRPMGQPKGTLEVVDVVGEHLSRTRITSLKDPNRDPVLEGDVLYNPSWNPTIPKHIALAGIMDLTGDGRDSLYEFMRNLERQNIVIDAYLDPKDFTIKGKGITVGTDFLVTGESLEFQLTGREKNPEYHKKIEQGVIQMKDQALKNGVQIVPLHKYLEMIGYRLPRSVSEQTPSLYNPNLRPDQAPRTTEKIPTEPQNK